MGADRVEREARIREFYEGRGIAGWVAAGTAKREVDNPLVNLCGDCGPLLDGLRDGLTVEELAVELGVHKRSVYGYLLEFAPVEWAKFSAAYAASRLEDATTRLEGAGDQVAVSREAALARTAQWTLERLAPRLYGAKGEGGVVVNVVLDPSCGGGVVLNGGSLPGAEASVCGQEG